MIVVCMCQIMSNKTNGCDKDKIEKIVEKVIIADIVSGSPPSCLERIYDELAQGRQLNKIPTDFAKPPIAINQRTKNVINGIATSFAMLVRNTICKCSGLILKRKLAPTMIIPIARAESARL